MLCLLRVGIDSWGRDYCYCLSPSRDISASLALQVIGSNKEIRNIWYQRWDGESGTMCYGTLITPVLKTVTVKTDCYGHVRLGGSFYSYTLPTACPPTMFRLPATCRPMRTMPNQVYYSSCVRLRRDSIGLNGALHLINVSREVKHSKNDRTYNVVNYTI